MKACARALGQRLRVSQIYSGSIPQHTPFATHSDRFPRYLTCDSGKRATEANNYLAELSSLANRQKHGDVVDKGIFLDVLESTATKREAKAYLSRFGPAGSSIKTLKLLPKTSDIGVNLGKLFPPIRAVERNPIFCQKRSEPSSTDEAAETIHVALIKIRDPQGLNGKSLQGVAHTISQLSRLGLSCVVVLDTEHDRECIIQDELELASQQAEKISEAISDCSWNGARKIDGNFRISSASEHLESSVKVHNGLRVASRKLLLAPLRRGMIPVITPVGIFEESQKFVPISANEMILALTREFAGIQEVSSAIDERHRSTKEIKSLQPGISIDRIIVLDPLGGIPAADRQQQLHVFVNLEQDFKRIKGDLIKVSSKFEQDLSVTAESSPKGEILETPPVSGLGLRKEDDCQRPTSQLERKSSKIHLKNLELLKNALALLPPSSSGFVTTPQEVANSESRPAQHSQGPRVRTRRQRNALIHNLLTDKPVISSSLPSLRLADSAHNAACSTFFKRGMPITVFPDPFTKCWMPPKSSAEAFSLSDPRIDLPRLVHLIEDSFGRKLDIKHYCDRIRSHIAGVIIAGEYEGGAILTWETPHNAPSDDPKYLVPYLDKFAVLKRSQGAGGVADIVFRAMVRDCFPNGVCWRSRQNNPVNKWYFERSNGTWRIPKSNWTMFWTTEGVERGNGVFDGYESVCKAVVPSWADEKDVID